MTEAVVTAEQARAARGRLWSAGHTAWKLQPTPRAVYEQIKAARGNNPFVLLAHRNFAKTTLGITFADEDCRRAPGRRWAVALRTKDQTAAVVREIMDFYLRGCPIHLRPKPVKSEFTWRYPNGSALHFFGGDNQAIESARGRGFHGALFDEGGFQRDLAYNVRSVALPALAKVGGGLCLITSTPSKEPGHDFEALYTDAMADARAMRVSVLENPDLTPEWIADRASECGGEDSIDFRREYLCEFLADPDAVVLPGVTEARITGADGVPALVRDVPVRLDREWYCALDVGGRDLTAAVWGYYDPEPDAVCIAREYVCRNASTPELARGLREAEQALFGARPPEYFERWADNNNLFLLHDLAQAPHGLLFRPTRKDEKMAQLGLLRRSIAEGRWVLDPSCTLCLSTFRKAQWVKTGRGERPTFAHLPDIGHADLLDATLYLSRNVRRRPYPKPLPTFEQQIGIPIAPPTLRSRGLRELSQRLQTEGWSDDE